MALLFNRLKTNPFFYILIIEVLLIALTAVNYSSSQLTFTPISVTLDNNYNLANTCLAGFLLGFMLISMQKRERIILALSGLLLEIIIWCTHSKENTVLGNFLLCGFGLYTSYLVFIIIHIINNIKKQNIDACIRDIEIFALSTAMATIYGTSVLTYSIYEPVYDQMLFAADGLTGMQPAFIVTAFVLKRPWLTVAMIIIYAYLPTWMLLAQAFVYRKAEVNKDSSPAFIPAVAYVIIGIIGTTLYQYFPCVGPDVYLGAEIFPYGTIPKVFHLPKATLVLDAVPRNAMPSLHLSYIVSSYMAISRLTAKYKLLYSFLVVSTLVSAFAIGKHWLSDFLVAMPFVTACIAAAAYKTIASVRWTVFAFGSLTSMSMMYMLKNHIDLIMSHSTMYLLTVFVIQILAILGLGMIASRKYQQYSSAS